MIDAKMKDDVFYVCSLVEYIARATLNHRADIVKAIDEDGIADLLEAASVNHCLSFEQVGGEVIEARKIVKGDFDTITGCEYKVPGYMDIGRLYQILIAKSDDGTDIASGKCDIQYYAKKIAEVFTSFISDEISVFRTGMYYQSPEYLTACIKAGEVLE